MPSSRIIMPGKWLCCPRCGYPNEPIRGTCQVCGCDLDDTELIEVE